MRADKALLLTTLVGSVCAAAPEGLVHTFDRRVEWPSPDWKAPTLSPATARVFLAQRLGLTQYHGLEEADTSVIESLTHFSGPQKPLFRDPSGDDAIRRILIVIDGVDRPLDLYGSIQDPVFKISNPPSPSWTTKLVLDFLSQDRHRRGSKAACSEDKASVFASSVVRGGYSAEDPFGTCFIRDTKGTRQRLIADDIGLLNKTTRYRIAGSPLDDSTCIFHINAYEHDALDLQTALVKIVFNADIESTTVVVFPRTSKHNKQYTNPYGTYEVPGHQLEARQLQTEAPLSQTPPVAVSSPSKPNTHFSPAEDPSATAMPKTTSPRCYKDETICNTETNHCTGGHGVCRLKFTNRAEEDKPVECWSCACGSTVAKDQDGGEQTTYWGGPACQKEDVSTPFFLLAGFTVALVTAVAWGVGLLYSVGQEELPSVIGAGVAGPRATK